MSTTDPEARVMKMPNGGFRPAYNVQLATDVSSGIVLGLEATNDGADQGDAFPMVEQVVQRSPLALTNRLLLERTASR